MSPEQFTSSLPFLTEDALPISPPFEFNGLTSRIFPLRANLNTVQQLVDAYLNEVPPEVGRFRAALPYVYLSVLDYGQIAEVASAFGWFAQAEVFFCVPLEWYRWQDGEWVFHDMAVITPFIYVDDRVSVPMGRSVYGFPKALANILPIHSKWPKDVEADETLFRLETDVLPELYDGDRLQAKTFLEITRKRAPGSSLNLPPDFNGPFAPWQIASNYAEMLNEFFRSAGWAAQASRVFPEVPGASGWMDMLGGVLPALQPGGEGMALNSLNLKQFRASAQPELVCYQGLTNGRMQITAIDSGGMLGGDRLALGDTSGGYRIQLSDYPSLPIVKKLGLEVERTWRGDGVNVFELAPVLPMWMKVDVLYPRGENLAWRGEDSEWRNGAGEAFRPPSDPPRAVPAPRFNTSVNPILDDIAGPFIFHDTSMRVLPLPADPEKLQQFLDSYVNDALHDPRAQDARAQPDRFRMRVWKDETTSGPPAFVYLVVSSIGGVTSKTNNVGDWARYDITVMVPMCWQRYEGDAGHVEQENQWVTLDYGVVPAYNFVDDSAAAISRREVQGIKTVNGQFIKPTSSWMDGDPLDGDGPHKLLEVDTEIMTVIGMGQEIVTGKVLEISAIQEPREPRPLDDGSGLQESTRPPTMTDRMARGMPVPHYTMKQFRDVADPARACFQSVQRFSRKVDPIDPPYYIGDTLRVRIYDYATPCIAEKLGVLGKPCYEQGAGQAIEVDAVDPVFVRCDIEEKRGEPLLTRVNDIRWQVMPGAGKREV